MGHTMACIQGKELSGSAKASAGVRAGVDDKTYERLRTNRSYDFTSSKISAGIEDAAANT